MKGELMRVLVSDWGTPGPSLQCYVRTHIDEIMEAIDKGYTKKQIAQSISKLLGREVLHKSLLTYVAKFKNKVPEETGKITKKTPVDAKVVKTNVVALDGGYYVKYQINGHECRLWKVFGAEDDIERFIKRIATKKEKEAGYKMKWEITDVQPMTRQEYEKSFGIR